MNNGAALVMTSCESLERDNILNKQTEAISDNTVTCQGGSRELKRHGFGFGVDLFAQDYNHTDYVGFEVFTAVIMKNGFFWDVTPCGSCKNRRFGGT
jgi:hypothetical protein